MPNHSSAPKRKKKKTAHRTEDIRCKGLKNVGHTCYINCIVQYIVNSPVTAFFLTGLVPDDPSDTIKDPLHPLQVSAQQRREVVRQLDAVVHALYREERAIAPTNLVAAVWKVAGVPGNTMEDAHVSWLAFANSLDAIILDPTDRTKCRFEGVEGAVEGRDITLARYLFGLTVWSTVTCSHCGHCSQTSETCFDLQVALPDPGSEQSPSMTAEPPHNRRQEGTAEATPTPLHSVPDGLSPRSTPMRDLDSSSSVGTDGIMKPASHPASQGGSMLTSAEPSGEIPSTTASEDVDMNGSVHKSTPRDDRHKSPLAKSPQLLCRESAEKHHADVSSPATEDTGSASIEDALRHVCCAEEIEGFRCAGCNVEAKALRQLSIRKLPSQLLLHIKRFQCDTKLRGHMHCPRELDMFAYTTSSISAKATGQEASKMYELHASGKFRYRLKAVVVHVGTRLHGGHFICYIRVGDIWNLCDDHKIRAVDWHDVQQAEAYIVCYEHSPA
eukprot:jgi/Ulvmu1/4557/UM002_0285.1